MCDGRRAGSHEGEAGVEAGGASGRLLAVFLMRGSGALAEGMRRGWIRFRAVDIFLFHVLGLCDATHTEGHKIEKEWKALLPSYPARLASKETMLERVVLLLGGAQANSHI